MLEKTKKFLVELLKSPRKLIQTLRSFEEVLGFKFVDRVFKERDSEFVLFLTACLLFVIVLLLLFCVLSVV